MKPRVIISSNVNAPEEILTFFHCRRCSPGRPEGMSPREYVSMEAGMTDTGVQVWCTRCDVEIVHVRIEIGEEQ